MDTVTVANTLRTVQKCGYWGEMRRFKHSGSPYNIHLLSTFGHFAGYLTVLLLELLLQAIV